MTAELALTELLNSRYPEVVVDIETNYDKDSSFEHPFHSGLLCVGLCYAEGKAIVITDDSLLRPAVQKLLAQVLETKSVIAHNGKFDLSALRRFSSCVLDTDTMLQSYCFDERPGVHGLKYLAVEILGAPQYDLELGRYKSFSDAPRELLYKYNAYDVGCTWGLKEYYNKALDADGKRLHQFLVNASNELMKMELAGIKVDTDYLDIATRQYESSLEQLEKGMFAYVNNPRSPKQIKEALEETLARPVGSTDAETLGILANDPRVSDFCEKLLTYRKEHKLYSTYLKGIGKRLYDGRIFTNLLLHTTVTGRTSSRNPNMQNIPRGSIIRNLFVPDDGNVFVQGDFSQAELRVVACEARDPYLREVFSNPERDIHQEVADRLGIPRQRAKTIVFGVTYGMEEFALAAQLGIDVQSAKRYQQEFFSVIPQVQVWKQAIKNKILKEQADLVTPYGRHRRIWLITDENKKDIVKEGTAFMPQSIASDINLDALVQLSKDGLGVRLPVHDSILVECPISEAEDVAAHMKMRMEEAGKRYSDYVPFTVEVKMGDSWGSL